MTIDENRLRDSIQTNLADLPGREVSANGSRPAAVLIPIFQTEDQWRVLFTKRTDKVETHKGQVSFPGGSRDAEDDDLAATALRETREEIGLPESEVELLGALKPMRTITNFLVYPFVGFIPYPFSFELNRFEVDSLIEVPLEQLIEEARASDPALLGDLSLRFNLGHPDVIWGATARILYDFLNTAFPRQSGAGHNKAGRLGQTTGVKCST